MKKPTQHLNSDNHFLLKALTSAFSIALCLSISVSKADGFDQRQAIPLTPEHHAQILKNMRQMQGGVQQIILALAENDFQAVAKHAETLGMKDEKRAHNPLHQALPTTFKKMGKSLHMGFDQLASDALTINKTEHTLQQLGQLMDKCQVCHAVYRVEKSAPVQNN